MQKIMFIDLNDDPQKYLEKINWELKMHGFKVVSITPTITIPNSTETPFYKKESGYAFVVLEN